MKKLLAIFLSLSLLTGCASLLEREYSTVEPHSSKFYESEEEDTLRAESYSDVVNDLLLLIGQHTETATLRLYDMGEDLAVAEALDRAISEVQQETALGAYAVEYITASRTAKKSHYEATVTIGYRRTAEQIQAVVSATSTEALYTLLSDALDQEAAELAVSIGYWGQNSAAHVEAVVTQLRADRAIPEEEPWQVNFYPAHGPVGLIEFRLRPEEELPVPIPDEQVPMASLAPVRVKPLIPFTDLTPAIPNEEAAPEDFWVPGEEAVRLIPGD